MSSLKIYSHLSCYKIDTLISIQINIYVFTSYESYFLYGNNKVPNYVNPKFGVTATGWVPKGWNCVNC